MGLEGLTVPSGPAGTDQVIHGEGQILGAFAALGFQVEGLGNKHRIPFLGGL